MIYCKSKSRWSQIFLTVLIHWPFPSVTSIPRENVAPELQWLLFRSHCTSHYQIYAEVVYLMLSNALSSLLETWLSGTIYPTDNYIITNSGKKMLFKIVQAVFLAENPVKVERFFWRPRHHFLCFFQGNRIFKLTTLTFSKGFISSCFRFATVLQKHCRAPLGWTCKSWFTLDT